MDLRGWARALRKNWWLVVVSTVLAVGVGVVITARTPNVYSSTVTFFVKTPAEQIGGAYQGDQFGQKRVNSYVQLIGSQRLADMVREQTQVDLTTAQVMSMISAKGDPNTVMLTARVSDTSPERSLLLAEAVGSQFVDLVAAVETGTGGTAPAVTLEVTSKAALARDPIEPRPLVNLGLAAALGLALGVALALLREFLDTSIRSRAEAQRIAGVPVLGVLPYDPSAKNSPLMVGKASRSLRAEAIRQLRTNLQFVKVDAPTKVFTVTSSVADEGKSSTSTNLAVAFAESDAHVLLIEADLRRPRAADYLGLEGAIGLTNVLAGQVNIDEVLQEWGDSGLTVLPGGSIPPNPSELLSSRNMAELMTDLRKRFDVIIIDTPPLLPVTDAAVVARWSDGALLVVRHGRTSRTKLATATSNLRTVNAEVLGTVLNMVPLRGADSYGYGYEYEYVYDAADGTTPRPKLEPQQRTSRHTMPDYVPNTAPAVTLLDATNHDVNINGQSRTAV